MGTTTKPSLTISAAKWSTVDLPTRGYYLDSCRNNLRRVASFWVEKEAELRGHLPNSAEGAESWLMGPLPLARSLRYLAHGVASGGRPKVPSHRLRIDGRTVSRVFPHGVHEGLLYRDIEAHVWSIGAELQGYRYRRARDHSPGPALVLAASNMSSMAPTDILAKLFCENRPVVCKLPNRLAPLEPILKEIFHPLIRDRHVQIVSGGPELGQELLRDETFQRVHFTGRLENYKAVLSESSLEEKKFTAELGCVTPVIIIPGPWTQDELQYQARHLASLMVFNGGYTCMTPQILVVSKHWSYKKAFLSALKAELKKLARRDDRLDGSEERRRSFRADYPEAECFGLRTLVELDATKTTRLFREEAFCGMLGWVEMEPHHPEDFMRAAAKFCNDCLWGDLSCMVIVDSNTRRVYERAIAQMQAGLEYGTVALNIYPGLAFCSCVTPWGSYQGGRSDTGTGWVHNHFFFDSPEKTVIEGPFIPHTPQAWIKPFPNLHRVGPAIFDLDMDPNSFAFARFLKAYAASVWKKIRGKNQ